MKTPCSGMEAITAGPFHCVFGTLLFGPLPAVLGDRVGLGLASSAPLLRPWLSVLVSAVGARGSCPSEFSSIS